MSLYVVVLVGANGVLAGRNTLRVVQAETPREAVEVAHGDHPPNRDVVHAWVHPLVGQASLLEVDVPTPEWGRLREDLSS